MATVVSQGDGGQPDSSKDREAGRGEENAVLIIVNVSALLELCQQMFLLPRSVHYPGCQPTHSATC